MLYRISVFARGLGGIFFKCFRKVALRGKAEVIRNKRQGLVAVAEQALCLLRFLAENKIRESHSRFLFKFRRKVGAAYKHRSCKCIHVERL